MKAMCINEKADFEWREVAECGETYGRLAEAAAFPVVQFER